MKIARSFAAAHMQQAACQGKQALTAETAKAIEKRSRNGVRAFKCPFCKEWHMGTAGKRRDEPGVTNIHKRGW